MPGTSEAASTLALTENLVNPESQNEVESISDDGQIGAVTNMERQEALESAELLAVDSYIPIEFADFV